MYHDSDIMQASGLRVDADLFMMFGILDSVPDSGVLTRVCQEVSRLRTASKIYIHNYIAYGVYTPCLLCYESQTGLHRLTATMNFDNEVSIEVPLTWRFGAVSPSSLFNPQGVAF